VGANGSSPIGMDRDVTGDPSRYHNVYNDSRDETGYPPYHQNLDTGFSPGVGSCSWHVSRVSAVSRQWCLSEWRGSLTLSTGRA
jgi:hypothetical protein